MVRRWSGDGQGIITQTIGNHITMGAITIAAITVVWPANERRA